MDPLSIAGLGASVVGNIVGGIATAGIAKKQQADLNKEKAYSEGLFNREYYQDVLKRTDNQAFLRTLANNQKSNQVKAQRTAAITGATPEAVVAQQANDSTIYAEAVNRMAGMAAQRKDMALAAYNQRRMGLFGMQNQIEEGKKAAWGTFMGNALSLGNGALAAGTSKPLETAAGGVGMTAIKVPQAGVQVTGGANINQITSDGVNKLKGLVK